MAPVGLGSILGGVVGSIGGGLLAGKSASETNRANLLANRENIAAREKLQQDAIRATGNLTTPFGTTRQDPDTGGFESFQPGGLSAATARTTLASGDVERARRLNELGRGFTPTVPTLAGAKTIVQGDDALQRVLFERGLSDIVRNRQRLGQGIQQPGGPFEGSTARELGDFALRNRFGGERGAIDLFQKARAGDISALQQAQIANQPQAGFPAFTAGGPGTQAGAVIAQTPPAPVTPDIGGAIPFQAGGNIFASLVSQEQARTRNKDFLDALRLLGNA